MTPKAKPFLPYGRQCVEDDDIAAVAAVLKSDYLTTGPFVEDFERAFAAKMGAGHAVACSSGTAALHLAAAALGLGPDDAVVVPSLTFLATANAARYVGAEVLFADVDPETGLLGADHVEAALTRAGGLRPGAVFAVHLNGHVADMAALGAVCRERGLVLVEDASHAAGAADTVGGARVPVGGCAHSAMATFSFHPVKAITMGEGGLVTTNDAAIAERLRRLRNHGIEREPRNFTNRAAAFTNGAPNPWYYEMPELGWNYRASDIACALGLSQLRKLDRFLERRRALAALYDKLLAPLAPAVRPVPRRASFQSGWHLYAVLIDFEGLGIGRAEVMNELRAQGIGTQVHYIPVHHQPYYRTRYGGLRLPGAERYYARCLSLPLFPGMTDADVARVADALSAVLRRS
jgi:UDP-4-amino-4,6-dideoxy-N-acetyl-beta-L-altrosamine transaminase